MSITWKWLWPILVPVVGQLLDLLTPAIKAQINEFLLGIYEKAKMTENPLDDFVMGYILDLFNIPHD